MIDDHRIAAGKEAHGIVIGALGHVPRPDEAVGFEIADVAGQDAHLHQAAVALLGGGDFLGRRRGIVGPGLGRTRG